MVATSNVGSLTGSNLNIKSDDPSLTAVTIISDVDLRVGTPIDQTAWLDGGAAAGSYPGALDGFQAKNSNTTNALGGLRMLTIGFNMEDAAVSTVAITSGVNTILGIIGNNCPLADKTLSTTFTHTGVTGNATTAPVPTGGAVPTISVHGEAAADGCSVTIIYQ